MNGVAEKCPSGSSTAITPTTRSHSRLSGFARSATWQSIERGGSHIAVKDTKIAADAKVAIERLVVPVVTAISQTAISVLTVRLGHSFEIVSIQTYCRAKAGSVSGDVLIGAVAVATITFTAATRTDMVLAAALADRRGGAADDIVVRYTSDGTGVLTNGVVVVSYRPVPLQGDVATE